MRPIVALVIAECDPQLSRQLLAAGAFCRDEQVPWHSLLLENMRGVLALLPIVRVQSSAAASAALFGLRQRHSAASICALLRGALQHLRGAALHQLHGVPVT